MHQSIITFFGFFVGVICSIHAKLNFNFIMLHNNALGLSQHAHNKNLRKARKQHAHNSTPTQFRWQSLVLMTMNFFVKVFLNPFV
jgi:hypothetical protein